MSRLRCLAIGFVAMLLAACGLGLRAQQVPTCPSTKKLNELVKALDDAISGPADKDRTCFRAVLLPNATLTVVSLDKAGVVKATHLTVDDWIERVKKHRAAPLYER